MGPTEVQKYVKAHGLEESLSTALNEAVAAKTDAPLLYVADAREVMLARFSSPHAPRARFIDS
tara:strand:+ start:1123 stop:1311 length:189 start_codon:yes stop_codon:yes gene_type:complete